MYYFQEKDIVINENSKILIGLGDSFTQGEGGYSLDIWEKYNWNTKMMKQDQNIDVILSGYENSWVNKICKNYLNDFTPINLGMCGRGNRAATKELHLHPELNLELAKEKIVIFMLSGLERFDFVHDKFNEHHHFRTIWPFATETSELENLWKAYAEKIYGDRFSVIELLLNIAEVKTWCKANNAKLILTSAFTPIYKRNNLIKLIKGDYIETNTFFRETKRIEALVDIINWNEFLYPENENCFTDYLLVLENRYDLMDFNSSYLFHEFAYKQEKLSPKGYISKCAHPSYKGYEEISKVIYNHMKKLQYI